MVMVLSTSFSTFTLKTQVELYLHGMLSIKTDKNGSLILHYTGTRVLVVHAFLHYRGRCA